ncbi:hypothetical protein B566_EDAN013324 [Ephemera danica]|nr:hypothetical protein B566_EDAN013324 [Ephemera danica]
MYSGNEKSYILPFLFSSIGTGINFSNDGYCVSLANYPSGFCLYAFDLTPDLSANSAHWCLQYDGNLRMELGFITAFTESVTIVFYAEYREILEMNTNQLLQELKELNKKCCVNHEIVVFAANMLPRKYKKPAAFIANTDEHHLPGTQWVEFGIPKRGVPEYFDSFAQTPLSVHYLNFMSRNGGN